MKIDIQKMVAGNSNIVKSNTVFVLIIVIITALAYSTAINNGFTSWDDNHYVVGNRYIKDFSKEGITKLWTERTGMGGTRLTLTSFMIDYRLWGLNPKLYHAENVIWHLLNSVLLFFLISRLIKKKEIAFVTAILFAVHPMHVESVAWIAERKDVLYTFFLLICFHAYISYIKTNKPVIKGFYWLAFTLSFYLSWHSKFTAVIIPPLLFLIDYILQRRFSIWLIMEKLPILVFTVSEVYRMAFGAHARMDFYGKKLVESLHQTYRYTLFEKSLLASYSLMFYLIRFFMPVKLSAIMPYPVKSAGNFPTEYYLAAVAAVVILVCTAVLLLRTKKNRREYIFGFLFFLISISVFLHFVSIKGVVVVADRYTYVPYIGLSFMVGIFLYNLSNQKIKQIAWGVFIFLVAILSFSTFQRNKVWKNDISLYSNVLKNNPNVIEALNNRGNAYNNVGRYRMAIEDFNRGMELSPNYKSLYNNRAQSYFQQDSFELALNDLDKAIRLDPSYLEAYLNKAQVYLSIEEYEKAVKVYSQCIKMAPYRAQIYISRANAYLKLDSIQNAIADYRKAIEVYPTNYKAFYELGRWYGQTNEFQLALVNLEKAKELNPFVPEVYNEMGHINNQIQSYGPALENLNKALELNPGLSKAYNNRGITNFQMNRLDDALLDFNKAIEIDTAFAEAYSNRGNLYASEGEFDLALEDYNDAIFLESDDCIVLVNRGNVYFQKGDIDTACMNWQQAMECGFQQAGELLKIYCKGK
jgi:tetratricopeptide (TPR) repeat protein